jgi:hypothetical protein
MTPVSFLSSPFHFDDLSPTRPLHEKKAHAEQGNTADGKPQPQPAAYDAIGENTRAYKHETGENQNNQRVGNTILHSANYPGPVTVPVLQPREGKALTYVNSSKSSEDQ